LGRRHRGRVSPSVRVSPRYGHPLRRPHLPDSDG
jgi:hypothetical protein